MQMPAYGVAPPTQYFGQGAAVRQPKRWGLRILVTLTVVALLVAAGIGAQMAGWIRLPNIATAQPPAGQSSGPASPPASTTSQAPTETKLIADSLAAEGVWVNTTLDTYGASCTLSDGLTATLGDSRAGSYRCRGLNDSLSDFRVAVDITLLNADSCAGIWFRFVNPAGYALKICPDRWQLYAHVDKSLQLIQSYYESGHIDVGTPVRVSIKVAGSTMTFLSGTNVVGTFTDNRFGAGKVILGVFPMDNTPAPYSVMYQNIEVWKPIAG
jgi:hypothetical protein